MSEFTWAYLVFGTVIIAALVTDLGLLSKKSKEVSIRQALLQCAFWVLLGLAFFLFVYFEVGHARALEYISAYLMEWSLSIDNIFVFLLIFSHFGVPDRYANRVLLYGILLAILLRIVFITAGVVLVREFHWILYGFGAFLLYTGISLFFTGDKKEFDAEKNSVYRLIRQIVPLTAGENDGRFREKIGGKYYFTPLFVVLLLLATTDVVFAFDSIPAVFAITQSRLIIYSSNIFAVLGLRSMFFVLKGAFHKFQYLREGIAVVLVFIGVKMLAGFFGIDLPVWISLVIISGSIGAAIAVSLLWSRARAPGS